MTAEIIDWPYPTGNDIPPERVLEAAAKKKFQGVVVMGFLENGETYMASSYADGGTVMWLMERTKRSMHEFADIAERGEV